MLRMKNPVTTSQRLSIYPEEIARIARLPKERRIELFQIEIALRYDKKQIYNCIFEHQLRPDGSLPLEIVYNCFKQEVKYLSFEPDYKKIVVEGILTYSGIIFRISGQQVYFM